MNNFKAFFGSKCPRCGKGHVFVSANPYNFGKILSTNKECPVCHLDFVPEIGFYWGATYMSYAITVAFSVFTFVVSTLMFGFMNSLNLKYVAVNGLLLFLFSPVFSRFSRESWLWMFYENK
jgi:hypothetical protein